MISQLMSRWRESAGRLNLFMSRDESRSARKAIIAALLEAESQSRPVYLRELHMLVGIDQPTVLRCVEDLEKRQKIEVEKMVLDPLAGKIKLL